MDSFIYKEILSSIGWFKAGSWKPFDLVNFVYPLREIKEDTIIGYFPGCFAEFHEGHLSTMTKFVESIADSQKYRVMIVLSPANADYTFSKYGDIEQASNKYRFDKIKSQEEKLNGLFGDHWCIDLNPMLNHEYDHNFTDLMHDFVKRHNIAWDHLFTEPFVICGKDRDFRMIENVTSKIQVFYAEDTTGKSSSEIIKLEPKPRIKKDLLLRVNNKEDYLSFVEHWKDQYKSISPIYLQDELGIAEDYIQKHKFTATCCKDYKHLLPYIHISRQWTNPFLQEEHYTTGNILGQSILDSDVYSGSTRSFVQQKGGNLSGILDFTDDTEVIELLDYEDFYKPDFRYPFVDISSRCSMQPFDEMMHARYAVFRDSLGVK